MAAQARWKTASQARAAYGAGARHRIVIRRTPTQRMHISCGGEDAAWRGSQGQLIDWAQDRPDERFAVVELVPP